MRALVKYVPIRLIGFINFRKILNIKMFTYLSDLCTYIINPCDICMVARINNSLIRIMSSISEDI